MFPSCTLLQFCGGGVAVRAHARLAPPLPVAVHAVSGLSFGDGGSRSSNRVLFRHRSQPKVARCHLSSIHRVQDCAQQHTGHVWTLRNVPCPPTRPNNTTGEMLAGFAPIGAGLCLQYVPSDLFAASTWVTATKTLQADHRSIGRAQWLVLCQSQAPPGQRRGGTSCRSLL